MSIPVFSGTLTVSSGGIQLNVGDEWVQFARRGCIFTESTKNFLMGSNSKIS